MVRAEEGSCGDAAGDDRRALPRGVPSDGCAVELARVRRGVLMPDRSAAES
ncbi:unnamed protein product [Heligmosomoides polygyrus]|uniref:Uncharacterized protein n=1 Tax=Heligmosomoides polygyrus TaxID=6339 RepID=A0A3P8IXD6_HELPZ|nr:unnamed protein product [Heligmosomoides polygyrus]